MQIGMIDKFLGTHRETAHTPQGKKGLRNQPAKQSKISAKTRLLLSEPSVETTKRGCKGKSVSIFENKLNAYLSQHVMKHYID